jgi:hypothetical protein
LLSFSSSVPALSFSTNVHTHVNDPLRCCKADRACEVKLDYSAGSWDISQCVESPHRNVDSQILVFQDELEYRRFPQNPRDLLQRQCAVGFVQEGACMSSHRPIHAGLIFLYDGHTETETPLRTQIQRS